MCIFLEGKTNGEEGLGVQGQGENLGSLELTFTKFELETVWLIHVIISKDWPEWGKEAFPKTTAR